MNARVRGWLTETLARLAAGSTPVDGSHDAGVRDASRPRSAPAQAPIAYRPGQTQFVRGLA